MSVSEAVQQDAVFVGVNKQAYVADYNQENGEVAFGASNNVALWNPLSTSHKGVHDTLKQHTKEVIGVKFIQGTPYFVSVAEDGLICVWKKGANKYDLHQKIEFHTHSVTCLTVFGDYMFATGSADGYIALWGLDKDPQEFKQLHSFKVKFNYYPLTLAIQDVDNAGNHILAVGGTTSQLLIYAFQYENNAISGFEQSAVMTGHEDWIKSLSFVTLDKHKSYLLASGCQDRYIRLWKLRLNDTIDDSDEDELKLTLLSNKQYKFDLKGGRAAFNFEALIMGHDDWITGLQWHPSYTNDIGEKKLQLLSSSADTGLMVWEMDEDSGIWCCVNRLGELSIKGASTATGSSGGFWSCLWFYDKSSGSQYILANGKTGSFRVYRSIDEEAKTFESTLGITGPIKEVTDLVWAKSGDYFTATSLDQTARLFAPWARNRQHRTWHEFARPQIHGYDMICIDNITSTKYVSGGDEKILRVFEMTNSINKLLKNLCDINIDIDTANERLPEAASLPVLGLSNKAGNDTEEADKPEEEEVEETEDTLGSLEIPPLEDHLQRYTLFPEIEKLYGHGYEITCCATSPSGTLIASACRSNSAKHAVIRLFNVSKDLQQCEETLPGHTLTITSLEFSPDGQYLLSVSRDRSFVLWKVTNEEEGKFELVQIKEKAHTRIIWDCSWVQNNYFVTGSRDKQVKLWEVKDKVVELASSIKLTDAITSVASYQAHLLNGNRAIVAVGLESGGIQILSVDFDGEAKLKSLYTFDNYITPSLRVAKLSFSKVASNNKLLLAVGSNDASVRVYTIDTSILV